MHEVQHLGDLPHMKKYTDDIDRAINKGTITPNEKYQLYVIGDIKFEGLGELVILYMENPKILRINTKNLWKFREKFDHISKIKAKTRKELEKMLNSYYGNKIQLQNNRNGRIPDFRRNVSDIYVVGAATLFLIATSEFRAKIYNKDKKQIGRRELFHMLQESTNNTFYVEIGPRTYMKLYETIKSLDIKGFNSVLQETFDKLRFPYRLIGRETAEELIGKLY
jgi:hypothetical protein